MGPAAIQRVVNKETRSDITTADVMQIVEQANQSAEDLKDEAIDAIADALIQRDKK